MVHHWQFCLAGCTPVPTCKSPEISKISVMFISAFLVGSFPILFPIPKFCPVAPWFIGFPKKTDDCNPGNPPKPRWTSRFCRFFRRKLHGPKKVPAFESDMSDEMYRVCDVYMLLTCYLHQNHPFIYIYISVYIYLSEISEHFNDSHTQSTPP